MMEEEEIKKLEKIENEEREKVLKQKMKELKEEEIKKELEKNKPKKKRVSRIKKIVDNGEDDLNVNDVQSTARDDTTEMEELLESFDTRDLEEKNKEKTDKAYELAIEIRMKEIEEQKLLEQQQQQQIIVEDINIDMESLMNLIEPVVDNKVKDNCEEEDFDNDYEEAIALKMKELEELKNKKNKRKTKKKILKDDYKLNLDDDCVYEEILDFIDNVLDNY